MGYPVQSNRDDPRSKKTSSPVPLEVVLDVGFNKIELLSGVMMVETPFLGYLDPTISTPNQPCYSLDDRGFRIGKYIISSSTGYRLDSFLQKS